jgi:membrane protein YqaA with SNARE-associated domain
MGASFAAMFSFFTLMFSALAKVASAANHLGTWADEAAGTFADESRHNRNERIKAMMKEAGITALPAAGQIAPTVAAPVTPAP